MTARRLHIIMNSHIDPVWIWNRSSGRSSWMNTIRSVVKLMKEFPEMKYTCSSSALYRWIEEADRCLFNDIVSLVKEKRWELTGGWEVQADTILSRADTLIRQGIVGKSYFMDKFGVDVRTAYSVDSFGHSAGLPKILKATGLDNYVYARGEKTSGLFKWSSDDGSSVTALQILNGYGIAAHSDKESVMKRTRNIWENGLEEQSYFFGLGDHGGTLSRTHIEWLEDARKEFNMVYSTLEDYFALTADSVKEEITGELGPVFRGCYSTCHEVKAQIASAVELMRKADALEIPEAELSEAWRELLFNHFHDILPGTSTKEAYLRDVYPGIGMVRHKALELIDMELARRDTSKDTSFMKEGGIQVWNPHPFKFKGIVSFDGFADPNNSGSNFNVFMAENGTLIPLQLLPPATSYGPCGDPWGRFTAVVELPPSGELYLAYARASISLPEMNFERQRDLLKKLSFAVFHDESRTWGFGLNEFRVREGEPELVSVREFLKGSVCSILRAEYRYKNSSIRMDLTAFAELPEIRINLQLDWHEKSCCLKLLLKHGFSGSDFYTGQSAVVLKRMESKYGGAKEWRNGESCNLAPESGELSMIDFCASVSGSVSTGFFSADLHSCDHAQDALRLTLLRPVLYADHAPFEAEKSSGWMDQGLIDIEVWHFAYDGVNVSALPRLADARLNNAETREVTGHSVSGEYLPSKSSLRLDNEEIIALASENEIHFFNYGEAASVKLPDGIEVVLPAKGIRICKK